MMDENCPGRKGNLSKKSCYLSVVVHILFGGFAAYRWPFLLSKKKRKGKGRKERESRKPSKKEQVIVGNADHVYAWNKDE